MMECIATEAPDRTLILIGLAVYFVVSAVYVWVDILYEKEWGPYRCYGA